jgi:hypothetical protein
MFILALEQNLQRPQLEYVMMIHSTVFTPLHSFDSSSEIVPSYFLSPTDFFILHLVWVSFGYMEGDIFNFITVFVVNAYQKIAGYYFTERVETTLSLLTCVNIFPSIQVIM